MRTLVPMERVEQGRVLELLVQAVHSSILGVAVPQMWEFSPFIAVSAMPRPEPAVVVQVVRRNLFLHTGTSFWHSPELGFGRKH